MCEYEKTPPPLSPSGMGAPHSSRPCPLPSPCWQAQGTALHHSCFSTVTHCSAPHLAARSPGVKAGLPMICALRVPARPGDDKVDRSESWVPDLCLGRGLLGTWTSGLPALETGSEQGRVCREHVGGDRLAWADCCLASHQSGLCWSA